MDKYQQIEHDWFELMCKIGRKEKDSFEEDNLFYLRSLISSSMRRGIMCWICSDLCRAGKLARLESLDEETKKQMWQNTLEICDGKLQEKDKLLQVCKTFYVIEYFLNEKIC